MTVSLVVNQQKESAWFFNLKKLIVESVWKVYRKLLEAETTVVSVFIFFQFF